MEGLATQIIVAGVGTGILALIGLFGILLRIFGRLGRLEKSVEVLEQAAERLDARLTATQEDIKAVRREAREDLQRTEERLRQEFRDALRDTEERLREEIRRSEERTREEVRLSEERLGGLIRNEIRRFTDAFVSHSHEDDGSILYRIPPHYTGPRPDGAGE